MKRLAPRPRELSSILSPTKEERVVESILNCFCEMCKSAAPLVRLSRPSDILQAFLANELKVALRIPECTRAIVHTSYCIARLHGRVALPGALPAHSAWFGISKGAFPSFTASLTLRSYIVSRPNWGIFLSKRNELIRRIFSPKRY